MAEHLERARDPPAFDDLHLAERATLASFLDEASEPFANAHARPRKKKKTKKKKTVRSLWVCDRALLGGDGVLRRQLGLRTALADWCARRSLATPRDLLPHLRGGPAPVDANFE